MEGTFALAGEATPDALDLYQRTAGNLRRLLESVGLQRRARDVTPTLREYLTSGLAKPAESHTDISQPTHTAEVTP
jgi:hypothetical protein